MSAPSEFDALGSISLLIRQAREGCPTSQERLLGEMRSYLEKLAKQNRNGKLASKLGQSDIVQQSMMKAHAAFDRFDGEHEAQWKAWLKVLLINEVRQVSRSYGRQRRSVDREETIAADATPPDSHESPLSVMVKLEQLQRMQAAVESLSDDYRKVVQMRTFEGLTIRQIADQMNRSVDATNKLWYRAVMQLQKLMQSNDSTQGSMNDAR